MKLHELSPAAVLGKRPAWRKGRGAGSGNGKTAGKGHKGQNARSGVRCTPRISRAVSFPLYRKLPKRGFQNQFATELRYRERFGAQTSSKLRRDRKPRSSYGSGHHPHTRMTVSKAYSATAKSQRRLTVEASVVLCICVKEKIEAAGGKTEVI